jgi:gluconokinase
MYAMQASPQPQSDNPLVLSLDLGSSSLRAALYGADGTRLEESATQIAYSPHLTPDGGAEIDPGALLDCIFTALDGTLQKAGALASAVTGVGMCSLVGNVLGVDEQGRATTPVYTWADTRCAAEAAALTAKFNEAAVRERTGCPIHSAYLPARLLWLRRTAPQAYSSTARWITIGDWLYLHLFGETAQSYSVASWNGLLNRRTLAWDGEWLGYLGVAESKLPPLVDADSPQHGLRAEFASRWPQLSQVPWFPCVGDGVASNLGSGCWGADRLAVQVGTSGAMRVLAGGEVAQVPLGLWCYRLNRDMSLLGGALSEGGNVFAWLREVLRVDDWDALEREAAALPPDSHGLTMLPFLAGERSPGWDPSARGLVEGLSLSTRPVHIVRAAQEAIAYRFGLIFERLRTVLPAPGMVVASGAALLKVPGWIGMLADVLGVPVTASAEAEATAKGVAMLTLRSLGLIASFSDISTPLGETYQPHTEMHDVYRQAMARQARWYDAAKGL